MRIKSYFAESVQDAIENARAELGPEAMLVNSRKTDPELKHLGAYEVVFGISNEIIGRADLASKLPPPGAGQENADSLAQELADLRSQIETVKRSVSRQNAQIRLTGLRRSPEIEELHAGLLAAEFSEETAQELVQAAERRASNSRSEAVRGALPAGGSGIPEVLHAALLREIEERLKVMPELGARGSEQRVVVFVGPPGAGKTTTLVKLAVAYGLKSRTSLQIVSADTLRVGGAEQLGAYARIIGAGFQTVHTMDGLEQTLEEHRAKKLVLVDTPGYGAGNMDEAVELAGFLLRHPEIEVQLVIPALFRPTVLARIFSRFEGFRPSKLLFTHLDDVEMPGAILDLAIRTGLPVSYLANGQEIPEDIEEASKMRLTEKLSGNAKAAAWAAA